MNLAERFWCKVDKGRPIDCWSWLASRNPDGYGNFRVDGRTVKAHRMAFILTFGYAPEEVCHSCDNPCCCNPSHLFGGTHAENIADMVAKGRHVSPEAAKTHCPQGHPYNETNTRVNRNRHGGPERHCRACQREQARAYRLRQKESA